MIFSKNVGVTVKKFSAKCSQHIRPIEVPFIFGNLGVEHGLKQHVTTLLKHHISVVVVKTFKELVGLFNEVDADGIVGLNLVPLATIICTKALHNLLKIPKVKALSVLEVNLFFKIDFIKDCKVFRRCFALYSVK